MKEQKIGKKFAVFNITMILLMFLVTSVSVFATAISAPNLVEVKEGEIKSINVNGADLEISALYISNEKVKIIADGETSGLLNEMDIFKLPDGTEITVMLIQEGSVILDIHSLDIQPEKEEAETEKSDKVIESGKPKHLFILEGDEKNFTIAGKMYGIKALYIHDGKAKLSINGENSNILYTGQNFNYKEKIKVSILSIGTFSGVDKIQVKVTTLNDEKEEKEAFATCNDEVQNGDEEGIDCGGSCKSCKTTVEECNGCLADSSCLQFGTRLVEDGVAKYCDMTKNFVPQIEKGGACQNNYECSTNQCSDGVCASLIEELRETKGMLQKITAWLKSIFGMD